MKLREIASSAMKKIGSFDPADLPAEFQPVINFVHRVTKLFNDIKTDVMGFVHVCRYIYIIILTNYDAYLYFHVFDFLIV